MVLASLLTRQTICPFGNCTASIARKMREQAKSRDPIWPESMPGAPGVDSGESAPSPEEQADAKQQPAGAAA